jgi:hypothetical protein
LEEHIKLNHRIDFELKCYVCEKKFAQKSDLDKHLTFHQNIPYVSDFFECDPGEKQSMRKGDLGRQTMIQDNTSDLKHQSIGDTTGRNFMVENDLSNHEERYKSDLDYELECIVKNAFEEGFAQKSSPNMK